MSGAILGGMMFGAGMIMARGCASRLLVLSATGNLRALISGLIVTLVAQASLRGVLSPAREKISTLWMVDGGPTRDLLKLMGGGAPLGVALGAAWLAVGLWLVRRNGVGRWVTAGAAGAQAYGWIVAESVARAYGEHRTWPDGERSPGLSITTFFDKKPDIDDETFYRIWHGEHTPLSFVIHPFWLYVRNQTLRPITPGAPSVRGIVYEAVPTDEDMLDFTRFFGCADDPGKLMDQIKVVDDHMETFGDRANLQCMPMREWIFKTLST